MKLVQKLSFCLLFLFKLFYISKGHLEYDGWIDIELQHGLNANNLIDFVYRGNVSIPSLSSGLSTVVQTALITEDLNALKRLAMSDGFYRLKAIVKYPTGLKKTFLTANKAWNLLSNNLHDEIWISIDANGYVNAITFVTPQATKSNRLTTDFTNFSIREFNTKVLIRHTDLAPAPDTSSFIQKIEREREARERGETKDNRGFFAKYWMYIVPVVLLVLISGATEPQK